MRAEEIERLKGVARRAYLTMDAIGDGMDCGHALACVISSRYRAASEEFDEAMARLRELDPTTPRKVG